MRIVGETAPPKKATDGVKRALSRIALAPANFIRYITEPVVADTDYEYAFPISLHQGPTESMGLAIDALEEFENPNYQ
jgi:hypothetical protein